MHKNAKTNSIRRNSRVAKKNPVIKRGLGNWFSDAYRWLNPLIFVHNNINEIKTFMENLFS